MDGLKDDAIHQTAVKLAEEIKNLSIYKSFYSDVQASHNTAKIRNNVWQSIWNRFVTLTLFFFC